MTGVPVRGDLDTDAEGRQWEETQGKGSHLQAKKPHKKATLSTPWSWTSSLHACEDINVCC